MGEPVARSSRRRPPGPPGPPAPPTTGDPGRGGVDPRDPGPPIMVQIDGAPLGDLGHPRVDARLLAAIALRDGGVAGWLAARGIDASAVAELPGSAWPLDPPLSWKPPPRSPPDADVIVLRGSAVGRWLAARGVDASDVEREYPDASWD